MGSILRRCFPGILISLIITISSSAQSFSIDGIEGIEFDTSNGDFAVTLTSDDDFSVFGISIAAESLSFSYTSSSNNFTISGSTSASFDGEEITADLTLSITDEAVDDITLGVTADFEIKSLTISPDNFTFEYDIANSQFEMYGDVTLKIGDDDITANMGDADDPGLVFDGSSITQVNIGVTTDFSLSGLKIEVTDMGVEWDSDESTNYNIYGDANLSIDSETVDVDFGDFSDPGIVIKNGSLHSFEVVVNSDLTFGNLEVTTDDVDIKYSNDIFEVTGTITIDEVFSLSVTLGSDDQAGLEIDVSGSEPTFKIEDLTIDIEHANLGTIDLKNFELEFNSDGIVESDLDVVFPSGTEIDATISFVDVNGVAELDGISIAYTADDIEEALELFEGVQIAYASGSVENLTNTSNLEISAELDLIYGGGVTIDNTSATLLETGTDVTVTSTYFVFSSSVNVGAYESGDDWDSLLGDGSIYMLVNFSSSVLAVVDVDIPSDPMVSADATVYLDSSGDFDALIDVTFYVPSSIPFIGGDKLGSVDGAIRYKADDISDSYAAGWTKIKVLWTKYYLGAKYKFKTRSVSTFDSKSTINDIKDDIDDDTSGKLVASTNRYINSYHTFEVYDDPVTPTMLLISADWGDEIDSVLVNVVGPEGVYELTRTFALTDTNTTTVPEFGYEENMNWVTNDTAAVFVLTSPSAFSEEEIPHTTLIDGRYQVVISMPADQAPDSVNLTVSPIFQSPSADVSVSKSGNNYEVDLDYWTLIPDSTHLSLYVNTENSYDSARLITHVEAENFDDEGYGSESIAYNPDFLNDQDSLYFFVVIDDGSTPPETSDIAEPFVHEPDFYGTVSFPENADSLKAGLRIFLDEDTDKSFDTHSTGGLEKFGITSEEGRFSISGIEEGTYEVRIVLPPGYRIVGGVDRFSHTEITFEGSPINLDIEIEAINEGVE